MTAAGAGWEEFILVHFIVIVVVARTNQSANK